MAHAPIWNLQHNFIFIKLIATMHLAGTTSKAFVSIVLISCALYMTVYIRDTYLHANTRLSSSPRCMDLELMQHINEPKNNTVACNCYISLLLA